MATKPTPPPASGKGHKHARRGVVAGFATRTASTGRFMEVSYKDAAFKGRELRTTLKKAGGSLVMTVPAGARDALNLSAGQEMEIAVIDNTMVLQAAKPARPKYTLDELLAECDFDAPYSDEERAWLDDAPVGRELL